MKKTICWVTPYFFIETDIYIIPRLNPLYHLVWFIVAKEEGEIPFSDSIKELMNQGVDIRVFRLPRRSHFSLKTLFSYWNIISEVKALKPDVVYSAMMNYPYMPLMALRVHKKKVIFASLNVNTPRGSRHYNLIKLYNDISMWHFVNYQTFSKSQYDLLNSRFSNKNVFFAPFVLKDYGKPSVESDRIITFLFFGRIRQYKAPDVVIRATEEVRKRTTIPFKVIIAGECTYWDEYAPLIINEDLFELRIHSIPNSDIPNLFARSHFTLLPYQDIAQSGALFVGINYAVPAILSDLPAFKEILTDKKDSLFIRPANEDDLVEAMLYVITNFESVHPVLRSNLCKLRDEAFSVSSIISCYTKFIDSL